MTLERTRQRRQAVGTIHDIVGAMRAIAAGRIQGAQRALAAARRYEEVVRHGIALLAAKAMAPSLPAVAGRPPLLLVLTSEQPFCGAFNQDVLALAGRRREELGRPYLVVVGQRGVRQLASRGVVPDASESAATSLPGLRDLVQRVARRIDARYAAGETGPLHVVYNRYRSVSEQVPTEEQVLPLDLTHFRTEVPPAADCYRYLPVPVLLAGLIGEYAFISLYRMAAESYVSEQASRLVAMDGASRNTDKMLEALLDLERRERQGQVTRQVLELIGARFAAE
jgi:F-type H+-transporting ATPase subunit gamma